MAKPTNKIPNVDQFLYCLVGWDGISNILATYASLGFHYDGKDRSGDSVRSIKRFMEQLDREALASMEGEVEVIDEDGSDDVLIRYAGAEYRFRAATLKDRIKSPDSDLGSWVREMVNKLGDERLLSLPYPVTTAITEAASRVAGFL